MACVTVNFSSWIIKVKKEKKKKGFSLLFQFDFSALIIGLTLKKALAGACEGLETETLKRPDLYFDYRFKLLPHKYGKSLDFILKFGILSPSQLIIFQNTGMFLHST